MWRVCARAVLRFALQSLASSNFSRAVPVLLLKMVKASSGADQRKRVAIMLLPACLVLNALEDNCDAAKGHSALARDAAGRDKAELLGWDVKSFADLCNRFAA